MQGEKLQLLKQAGLLPATLEKPVEDYQPVDHYELDSLFDKYSADQAAQANGAKGAAADDDIPTPEEMDKEAHELKPEAPEPRGPRKIFAGSKKK